MFKLRDSSREGAMSYPNYIVRVNDGMMVEQVGLSDFKISFDRTKYFLTPTLIDALEAHISSRSHLSADLDTSLIGAGIIRLSFNAVFLTTTEDVPGIIDMVIRDLLLSTSS